MGWVHMFALQGRIFSDMIGPTGLLVYQVLPVLLLLPVVLFCLIYCIFPLPVLLVSPIWLVYRFYWFTCLISFTVLTSFTGFSRFSGFSCLPSLLVLPVVWMALQLHILFFCKLVQSIQDRVARKERAGIVLLVTLCWDTTGGKGHTE